MIRTEEQRPCLDAFRLEWLFPCSLLGPVDSSQLRRFAAILLLNETTLSELFPFTCKPPVRTWSLSVSLLFRQHNFTPFESATDDKRASEDSAPLSRKNLQEVEGSSSN